MTEKINNVTSDAVKKATGYSWDEWIAFIDANDGKKLDHKAIVALVGTKGGIESGWWQQMVTVGYEHSKGRRKTGQTADAGFQIGVQRTISLEQNALWKLLTGNSGLKIWLGKVKTIQFRPGESFETDTNLTGEIRSVQPGERIRLTWKPKGRKQATILQLTLSCPRNTKEKTTLRFHHEKLLDKKEREKMQSHWKQVLDELAGLAANPKDP